MFDGLKRLWGRIVSMFNYTTLKNIIGKDVALSQTMIDAINKWKKMLVGNADWCSDIVESLKLEEGICREFADSVLVEMEAKILNNDKMDRVLQKSLSDMNKKLQTGLALGAMVLRPLGPDAAEYVAADKFIVISFADDGTPNDIAFLVVKCIGENDYYTRVERHYFTNGNLTIGFYLDYNGKKVLTPLSQVYSNYLDNACFDIVTGAFDYGSVLRRVVTQLTNSGLRKIEYGSGYASRVEVAARRAVMTGVANLTGEIADYNAKKLGTEYFEVEWHAGARPTHAVWQGRVWTKEQLYSVCGLGTVTGLLGANCYHAYYPFFPGISRRNWSDEWLEEQNRKESKPKEFRGKEYTLYEAKQRQRQMETAMRAQREKVQMLQDGGADRQEVMLQKAKYQGQLNEYAAFSRKMGLKEERERIYIDGRGRIAPSQYDPKMRKVSGKIDGKEVIFERAEGDRWNATVPYDLDGMYVVELTAENDAGNIAYCTKMLLIVDPATLCVRLVPLDYMVEVVPEDYKVTVISEDYAVEAVPEQYQVIAEPDPLFVEVIYPIHGRGCCCEQN